MKNFKWYEWAILALLMGMLLIGGALSPWGQALFHSEGAPAWIQAIFSVVAIVSGAGFVLWQHTLQMRRDSQIRIEERIDAFEPICSLIGQAHWLMAYIQDVLDGYVPAEEVLRTDVIIDDVGALLGAMDRVNVHQLPTGYLCAYFIDVCRVLRKMEVQLRHAANRWRNDLQGTKWRHELLAAKLAKESVAQTLQIFRHALTSIERGERPKLPI
ncbi:hypothetical protein ABFG95_24190 [Achromobacter sp. HNDS-1]|uniref:Uncharacterized protein n=1 Tax=Achromobacter sp. HNDS-1 TaxID=3151598 RepID=A0AAU7L808_9BURK|nr:hypothetical protein [Achromobacter ruhlandii]CAB3720755.1 hypothetical protein LMG1866_03786 [Achromobacter ruhlandii]